MVKIQVRQYWKHYLTKAKYRYKTYYVYVPKHIAEQFLNIDLSIRKIGPFIVIAPREVQIENGVRPESKWICIEERMASV